MKAVDIVYKYLEDGIINKKWEPKEKIPSENELCEILEVSRAPVRDATNRMIGMGVLESRRGGGTYVCEYNILDFMEVLFPFFQMEQIDRISMFEFRKIIETQTASLSAMRASADMVDEMRKINTQMEASTTLEEIAKYDFEFHFLIAKAAGNPAIDKVFQFFSTVLIKMFNENVETLEKTGVDYHSLIINAIEIRNPELAKKLMLEHINKTAEAFGNSQQFDIS